MRRFFPLLALIALLMAPLAAPAAAMAPEKPAAECAEMDMSGHQMPDSHHGQDEACCIAVPPAIDPPSAALDAVATIDHLAFVGASQSFLLGAGPNAEDPPPRPA
jgi:hypothetical protein